MNDNVRSVSEVGFNWFIWLEVVVKRSSACCIAACRGLDGKSCKHGRAEESIYL